jgi:hypothetical protein
VYGPTTASPPDTFRPPADTTVAVVCRHPEWDDLYADEVAEHVEAGCLEVHRAYARSGTLRDGRVLTRHQSSPALL